MLIRAQCNSLQWCRLHAILELRRGLAASLGGSMIPTNALSRHTVTALAARQLADYDARTPGTIFADPRTILGVDDAYRVQIETAHLRSARGEGVVGYKIGCVSRTIQRQLGVENPVFGHLFDTEIWSSPAVLPEDGFCDLGIEGEFALTVAEDIPDPERIRDAPQRFVRNMFPVIELHNFLFRAVGRTAAEVIANNAFHAGIVVPPRRASLRDREELPIRVSINGQEKGCETVNPLETLYQLASRLSSFGIVLSEGDVVLAGSPLPLYPVDIGDCIRVECSGRAVVTAEYGGAADPAGDAVGS